jgi:hypothetical protein
MEKKASIMLIAMLAAVAILASAALAAAQATTDQSGASDLAKMALPKAVVMALSSSGVEGGNATFSVPYSAKVFDVEGVEYGAVSTTKAPVRGSINAAEGMGVLSTADSLPASTTTDLLNKSAFPVAGASEVISLQDMKLTGKDKGTYNFDFGKLAVYLPDGTRSEFTLAKPIRLKYTAGQATFAMETDPAVAATIAGTLRSGVAFPANAKPVPLSKLLGAT